jgi:hypothetical protein
MGWKEEQATVLYIDCDLNDTSDLRDVVDWCYLITPPDEPKKGLLFTAWECSVLYCTAHKLHEPIMPILNP